MRIDISTLFPEMCKQVLNESIIGRAQEKKLVEIHCHNIRDYSKNKNKRVDDYTYGGGRGMVIQAQPVYDCYVNVCEKIGSKPYVIYMSPKGSTLTQKKSFELSKMENIYILCGHYEGIDQRVIDEIVDEEISIGDYVLTGGELPAIVLVDSIVRLLDNVLSSNECFEDESHYNGLLEYPQYTRPRQWNNRNVPEVLLSGHFANIEKWRLEKSLELTRKLRPDMYDEYLKNN